MEEYIKKAMIEANELGLQGIKITGCFNSWTAQEGMFVWFSTDPKNGVINANRRSSTNTGTAVCDNS